MKNISQVVKQNKCTGCGACVNICPQKAISIKKNKEGFNVPTIDKGKCNGCNLCNRTCPVLNKISKNEQYSIPKLYAGWNKNEKIRMDSSSGGVFNILANHFLDKKGYVCGAAFNKNNKLEHIIISKKEELHKLRGSKYTQSKIGDVFSQIKKLLEKDSWVLFSGTPCQTAGLKSFLKKDYEKLLSIDILCHGAPSPVVLKKYLKEIEEKSKAKIKSIKFRDKKTGWASYSFTLSNGKKNVLDQKFVDNIFFNGFLNNLYLNKACTNCQFSSFPRCSDITLGDFWGIGNFMPDLDDNKGTSLISLNNKKGVDFFRDIKNQIYYRKIIKQDLQQKLSNISLPASSHVNRNIFFEKLSKTDKVSSLIKDSLSGNLKPSRKGERVAIFNMRIPTCNYGAVLQSYALYKTVNDLGYKTKVINYISKELDQITDKISQLNIDKFRENNISYTLPCYDDGDLVNLNKDFDTFIVGSDQVWNYTYLSNVFKKDIAKYFLNFALPSKNIISYAASFAKDKWEGDSQENKKVKRALSKFSGISVREKSGVSICEKLFKAKAICVLDPTLLLNSQDYQLLIDSENIISSEKDYLSYFTLDNDLEKKISKNKNLTTFCEEKNLDLKNIRGQETEFIGQKKFIFNTVPEWLNYIKNSKFIVTDSYHCVIFSIIFKKNFLFIQREYAGNERLKSLFSILKIENRFFKSLEDVNLKEIYEKEINYKKVNGELEKQKEISLKFLKTNLAKKKNSKTKISSLEDEVLDIKLSRINGNDELSLEALEEKKLEIKRLKKEVGRLENSIKSYQSTKTFLYSKKLKKLLFKIGINKFKL